MNTLRNAIAGTALLCAVAASSATTAQSVNANEASARLGLVVRLEAKPGKGDAIAAFLRSSRAIVQDEAGTTTWYAVRLGPTTFGIFDTFANEAGREAHLTGRIPQALTAQAAELLAQPPVIERAEILATKIPE